MISGLVFRRYSRVVGSSAGGHGDERILRVDASFS